MTDPAPERREAAAADSAPDRSRPPPPEPLRPLRLPGLERFRLASGLEVWAAETRELPEVSVRMVVDAGASQEPAGLEGTAALTARLLTEGTPERSAMEMAEWQDRLGAGFGASAGYDACLLSLHVVSDVLEEGLDFLRAVVREPAFADHEVERVRRERLDEIERERDEPDVVADHALIAAIYGDHRFALPSAGVEGSVSAVDRDAVVGFHAGRFSPGRSSVIACGDVPVGRIREALEARFGDWEGGGAGSSVEEPPDRPASAGRVVLVDRPGSPQAEVRAGTVGTARDASDYFAAVVANAILGGLFNSRVNMNLREEKGWTYGARTRFHFRRVPGPFVAGAAVETPATAEALSEVLAEIRGMRERPPDDEEIRSAKDYLILSLPRRFETPSQISRRVATQVVYGLPPDYWERYREGIEGVGRERIVEVAERYLRPESFVLVAAADAERTAPALEERFGGVDVRSSV